MLGEIDGVIAGLDEIGARALTRGTSLPTRRLRYGRCDSHGSRAATLPARAATCCMVTEVRTSRTVKSAVGPEGVEHLVLGAR